MVSTELIRGNVNQFNYCLLIYGDTRYNLVDNVRDVREFVDLQLKTKVKYRMYES